MFQGHFVVRIQKIWKHWQKNFFEEEVEEDGTFL